MYNTVNMYDVNYLYFNELCSCNSVSFTFMEKGAMNFYEKQAMTCLYKHHMYEAHIPKCKRS